MRFFLDTASSKDIQYWGSLGLVDGVTTNPVILAKTGVNPLDRLKEILEISDKPVSVQLTADNTDAMVAQAERFASLGENIVVKVPASPIGYYVASRLKELSIPINVTLIFHPTQAIPFIRLNAEYVSLFLAVAEDTGLAQQGAITGLRQLIDRLGSQTQLIACSIRTPEYLWRAVTANAHVLTVPPACWEETFRNPHFTAWADRFRSHWYDVPPDIRNTYDNGTEDVSTSLQR